MSAQLNIPQAPAPEAVKVRCVESLPSIFEADVQSAVDEIMAIEGARILSVAPYPGVGGDPKPSAMITYAVAAEQPTPGPARGLPVAPGDYLAEWMEEQGPARPQLADILGCTEEHLAGILRGNTPITPDMAVLLEPVVGIPAASWLRYEAAYQADIAAREAAANLALPVDEAGINAAAKALSPNPKKWQDFVPTVRKVISAIQGTQRS